MRTPARCVAIATLLAALNAAPAVGQLAGKVAVILDEKAPKSIAAAIRSGAERAASHAPALADGSTAAPLVFATPREFLAKKGGTDGAVVVITYAGPMETAQVSLEATKRGTPVIDLGHAAIRGKQVPYSEYRDPVEEANCAVYWLLGPFAHHDIAILADAGPLDVEFAKAFEKGAKAIADKHVVSIGTPPSDAPSTLKAVQKIHDAGATAVVVAAPPEVARLVATAAKQMNPPLVVLAASSALGFEAADPKDADRVPMMPEGTAILARDLPEVDPKAVAPDRAILWQEKESSFHELETYDVVLALVTAKGDAPLDAATLAKRLDEGTLMGQRGSFAEKGKGETFPSGRLRYVPWFVDGPKLRPFPQVDPNLPSARPTKNAYPTKGLPEFIAWNTAIFKSEPGAVVVDFDWTDGKIRTIEGELAKLNMCTSGRQPVVDHVVREKLLCQVLSVASTKFLRKEDGSSKPGESFNINLVHRRDPKVKPRLKWRAYCAGDDPEAGGRAFGSYCFIYSTFIYRTIFTGHELEDTVTLDDLKDLVLPTAAGDRYVAGTRRNVMHQIIVGFGGSMALTAAHEIGHLAGLAHDEKDPHSIMNVKEGAGMAHDLGIFIPEHMEIMKKSLGIVPNATTKG